ncbi:MAG: c-type cytochrome [Betaproteobacteria bacterium]|nr:c-type cytochrome [Betaproteobacteria bacterium]
MKALFTAGVLALASASAHAADANHASYLASTCASCHGTDGKSTGSVASLAGQPAADLLTKLAEFKDGTRPATIMHQIAKGYTGEQLKLIAEFFSAQK